MKKAMARQTEGRKKSIKKTATNRDAGNSPATKTSRTKTFDPDALLNSAEGMVFVASADLRLEYMNETARRKLGRDLTGRPCHKALHGLEERCPWCTAGLVLQGQTVRQEVRGQRDGRWYSSVMTPIHREDGSIAIQSLVFDITEQKLAEVALTQSEALLKSILQSTPTGIGMVRNRVLEWTNEQISRITGYAPEELRGKSARVLYPSDEEFDRVGRHKYAEIQRQGTGSIVTVWRRKDGKAVNIFLSSTPIDSGNLSAGVVFTALDITEKMTAQDELWKSEEKYRALFENAVMGIFQSTPEGRFLRVNPATAKMCGYDSPGEMVASITDIASRHYVDPADREPFIRAIEEQGFVRNFEHRAYRKDGSIFWVSVNARAIRDKRGRITHYEGTHEDIQQRKEPRRPSGRARSASRRSSTRVPSRLPSPRSTRGASSRSTTGLSRPSDTAATRSSAAPPQNSDSGTRMPAAGECSAGCARPDTCGTCRCNSGPERESTGQACGPARSSAWGTGTSCFRSCTTSRSAGKPRKSTRASSPRLTSFTTRRTSGGT